MRKNILFSAVLLLATLSGRAQETKLFVGVSDGHLSKNLAPVWFYPNIVDNAEWNEETGFQMGIQEVFRLPKRFSISTTIMGKVNRMSISSFAKDANGKNYIPEKWDDKAWVGGLAANASVFYRIVKGFKIGCGMEPTFYFKTNSLRENQKKNVFDYPIVVSLGYEFHNGMEIDASYKHGFKDIYSNPITSGNETRTREFSLGVSIPLFKK